MNIMQWISFTVILILLITHGFWPTSFILDKYSMGLLFLLAIPLLFPFLKKAKWFGAEFEFKDAIEETKKLVEASEKQVSEISEKPDAKTNFFETFRTQTARELVDKDPNLSLAAIRIEIEKLLSNNITTLISDKALKQKSLRQYIKWYLEEGLINNSQADALITITNMCNKAVHGASVTRDEAEEIIELTERLNISFSIGYSINTKPNLEYKNQGLSCEWQHCVEHFPITEERTNLSCPVFGHNCPGGIDAVKNCKVN